jgi:hypothetical protein
MRFYENIITVNILNVFASLLMCIHFYQDNLLLLLQNHYNLIKIGCSIDDFFVIVKY